MSYMGWIYIIGLLIAIVVLNFMLWMEKRRIDAANKEKIRLEQKMKFQTIPIPTGTIIPIQGTGKSILFEEMKEKHKNRELKDLNEEEDIIEKMLREARSRK